MSKTGGKRDVWITVIAVGKLLKTTILVVAGVMALRVASSDGEEIQRWIARTGVSPGNHLLHEALSKIGGIDHHTLAEIGVGTFVYAALFLTEGLGLLSRKRWAEYFTIFITGSFIPLEIYEIVRHFTVLRVITLVLNAAALAYIVWHVRHKRSSSSSESSSARGVRARGRGTASAA